MSLRVRVQKQDNEHLIYLSVPEAGGDGALLGVVESEAAANEIAAFFRRLIDAAPYLPKVVKPG